jgi:3-oxoacyl-[acyl-carrier-protein] synthase-1
MAAVRAGLSRIVLDPEDAGLDNEDVSNIARIVTLSTEEPMARGWSFLDLAIEQALTPIARGKAGALRVWFAGPAMPDAPVRIAKAVTNRLGFVPAGVDYVGSHGSSALFAAEMARTALGSGSIDFALVVAFDVRSDSASLTAGLAAGRIIGPGRCWGYVPGEAGAAILLASESAVRRSGLRPQASLLLVASGREPNPLGSAVPCVGRGLTDAIRLALGPLPANTCIRHVFCDLNGERARADEWGFTTTRIASRLRDPGDFVAPAVAWGDCGAASGLLLLALAAATREREEEIGTHSLVWTSSDSSERAAALIRVAAQEYRGGAQHVQSAKAPPLAAPPWAEDLDSDILQEMAEECVFRYEQRAYQIAELVEGEPPADWRAIERTEETMDALAVGLAECSPRAQEITQGAADPESPGTIYVAVRALLENGETQKAIGIAAAHLAVAPKLEPAIVQAFLHAQRSAEPPDVRVSALLAAGAPLSWIAVQVAASAEIPVAAGVLAHMAQAVPPDRTLGFLGAIGRVAPVDLRPYLARWERSTDPAIRREAALADVLIGRAAARESLLARAEADSALLLPAALVVDARRAAWLLARAQKATDSDSILAVAISGNPLAVPWLLELLGDGAGANAAACGLELLLGTTLLEEYEVPDEDERGPARKAKRVCSARGAWESAASQVLRKHPRELRLRGGSPATVAAASALLDRPHLPLFARRYLGHELAVRWGTSHAFDASAPVRMQRTWLARAKCSVDVQPPGSWNVQAPLRQPGLR